MSTTTTPARSVLPLVACGAASLGLLFLKGNELLTYMTSEPGMVPVRHVSVVSYLALALPILTLLGWHRWPHRSWPWLLLTGAICTLPFAAFAVRSSLYRDWMNDALLLLTDAGAVCTLVGLLGAATWMCQAGRRNGGAALIGTVLVVQLVGPVVLLTMRPTAADLVRSVYIGLPAIALIGSGAAVWQATRYRHELPRPDLRPGWRATIAGGLVAAAPLLPYLWQPHFTGPGTYEHIKDTLADYYLYIGLALLTIGLVAGTALAPAALVPAAGTGLMLGAFGMLILPSVEILVDYVALTAVAAVGSVVIGFVLALSRWRARIGSFGLAGVVAGLVVVAVLVNSDRPFHSYEGFIRGVTPVLVIVGIIAGLAAISAIGAPLAANADAPATLAGLTTPFTLATIAIIGHFGQAEPADKAPLAGLLPPTAVALFVAALLVLVCERSAPEATPGPNRLASDASLTAGETWCRRPEQ